MKKIAILMGGNSPEHEVSLKSGEAVFNNIDTSKYLPERFLINPDGSFDFEIEDLKKVDVVFIALHGTYGEDGRIQGFLETLGLSYTGPNVLSSALGMDKYISKQMWDGGDLPIIPHRLITSAEDCKDFDTPFVIKPRSNGSSLGVSIVRKIEQVDMAFSKATKYGSVMLEKYIDGRELTVGVLMTPDGLIALPIIEIFPHNEFYDYDSKYLSDETKYKVVDNLDGDIEEEIKEVAVSACNILGIDSYSRVDFILDQNQPYLMEVNTLPGMTSHSLLPKSALAYGISFTDLISKMIELA